MLTKQKSDYFQPLKVWDKELKQKKEKKKGINSKGFAENSLQKIHTEIKTICFSLTTISFVQTKSCEYGLYSLLLMNYFNSYTEKLKERLSNFAKEVFMTEPFKVRGFIVTQKKNT